MLLLKRGDSMSLKILHTGDVHIGMKFNNYRKDIQQELIEARFDVLNNIISKANEENCNILAIAGDLFDKHNIPQKSVIRVIDILDRFSGDCILILPGNHDFDNGAVELWESFRSNMTGKMVLLDEFEEYDLTNFDIDAAVYPAHCDAKHSDSNNLDWIKNLEEKSDCKYKIGLAHGALSGLSPDMTDDYFKMDQDELDQLEMDIWLLGHTHVPYPEQEEVTNRYIYNSGTPEPDGLDCTHGGNVWLVEIDEDKNVKAKSITTGNYRFYDLEFNVESENDFEDIKDRFSADDPSSKVVRLNLKGRIEEELYGKKEDFYKDLKDKLAYLLVDDNELKIKITKEVINDEFTPDSFPHQLLSELEDDEKALQLAYEFIREVKECD